MRTVGKARDVYDSSFPRFWRYVEGSVITALALSPSIDVTYVVGSFTLGSINRPAAVHRVAGGKGLNAARAAHLLGADVAAVAILGGSSGAWVAAELDRAGLPLYRVNGAEPTRTCVSIADDKQHTMTEIYEQPGTNTRQEWSELNTSVLQAVTDRPGWLTISGSLPAGAPPDTLRSLVGTARQAGSRVAVDLHGRALADALGATPDLVKVNAAEAAELLGVRAPADTCTLARLLAERTRTCTVVTAGVDGAYGVTANGAVLRVSSAERGPYPVGSGDCLLGGLVAGLNDGRDLLDSLVTATAAATANALRPGAACFGLRDVESVLTRIEVGSAMTHRSGGCQISGVGGLTPGHRPA